MSTVIEPPVAVSPSRPASAKSTSVSRTDDMTNPATVGGQALGPTGEMVRRSAQRSATWLTVTRTVKLLMDVVSNLDLRRPEERIYGPTYDCVYTELRGL